MLVGQSEPQALKTLEDQPLSVRIASGTIHAFGDTSEIDVQLQSSTGSHLAKASFDLLIVNGNRIVAGEEWVEQEPGASLHRQTKEALHKGDEAYLILRSVTIGGRTASLDAVELSTYIKNTLTGRQRYRLRCSFPC